MKISILNRILLLLTTLAAAWQVAVGINGLETFPIIAYTIGFGVLLVAALLLLILGYEALDSPVVVVVSTIIPLSLALGLIWEYWPSARAVSLIFALCGFAAIVITRAMPMRGKLPVLVLAVVHGLAGLTIVLLPLICVLRHAAPAGFLWVSFGGMLIGLAGMALSLLKAGKPLIPHATLLKLLPFLLFVMTTTFVAGFVSIH